MTWTSEQRDEVARILTQVAEEGLEHPRNLDAALDAIAEATFPIENNKLVERLVKIRARSEGRIKVIRRKRSWSPSEKALAVADAKQEQIDIDQAIAALSR